MPASSPLILMVRHGRTQFNKGNPRLRAWENPSLSREGKLDAQLAGQQLKKYSPKMVYSSDLLRDTETGIIISQELGNIPFDMDFDLRTSDMGELGGELEKDVFPLVEKWYHEPWWRAPSGESCNEFLSRFYKEFDLKFNLAKESEAFRPIVLVTHGRDIAATHARADMIPQWEAMTPYPGGILSVGLDEVGRMQVEFLGDKEPILADV